MRFGMLARVLLVVCAGSLGITAVEGQTNLVANPGVEELGKDGQMPASWPVRVRPNTRFFVDRQEKHSGNASLSAVALEGASGKDFESLGSVAMNLSPASVVAHPGETFEYGLWYRSKGWATVFIQPYLKGPTGFNPDNGAEYINYVTAAEAKDVSEWKRLEGTFVAPNKTEQLYTLVVGAWLHEAGAQVWFDDVTLAKKSVMAVQETKVPPSTGGQQAKPVSLARMPLTTWAAVKTGPWHFTSAVAFPQGAIVDPANVRLVDEQGKELPAEFSALDRWGPSPQDFVRWMRIEFPAEVQAGKAGQYSIEYGTQVRRAVIARPVEVKESADAIEVDAGRLVFTVRKRGTNFLDKVLLDGQTVLSGTPESGPFMLDHQQREYRASLDPAPEVVVHERNALRVVIRITGRHYPVQAVQVDKRDRWPAVLGKYHTYIVAYAGQPYLRIYHTFVITEDTTQVRYRDIGLRIPANGQAAAFGVDGQVIEQPAAANPYLLQRDIDDLALYALPKEGQKVEQARKQKSDGWFSLGSTAVVVRDLWQNYPKELEVVPGPAQSQLVIHFWPRHGEKTPDRKLTRNNVGLLWFCHEGEELSFTPPKEYVDFVPSSESPEWGQMAASPGANAMGLAKTHEFLLIFGETAASRPKLGDLAALYQQDPHALQSPESLCASGAFGRIHPYDIKRFPIEEDSIRAPFEFFMRTAERLRDYGMFNFGDLHEGLQYGKADVYAMHRHWNGAHHEEPRMPWILYARSGDPLYLTMARRNAQHVMDVDTVHYGDERFAEFKAVTGQTFPHFLHWMGGSGPSYFEANVENKFWWYYFTGNPRGLDTAREWIEAIIARPTPSTGREGSGTFSAIIEAYEATWDPRLLKPMEAFKRSQFSVEPWEGHFQGYAPSLEKYNILTRSKESADRLVRWARHGGAGYGSELRIDSHAYWLTRDPALLQASVTSAYSRSLSVYHEPGSKLDGFGGDSSLLAYTYYMNGMPFVLAALVDAGEKAPKPNLRGWQGNVISLQGLGAFHFMKEAGKPVTVDCAGSYASSKGDLIGPDGKIIKQYVFGTEKIALPAAAAAGEYMIRFTDPDGWRGMNVTTDAPKAVFQMTNNWGFNSGILAMYFWVPKETTSFSVGFKTRTIAGVGRVFDPEGAEAGVVYYPQEQPALLEIKPKPEQTGKLWRLFMSEGDNSNHFTLTGVPPFVCGDPDRFFLPQLKAQTP